MTEAAIERRDFGGCLYGFPEMLSVATVAIVICDFEVSIDLGSRRVEYLLIFRASLIKLLAPIIKINQSQGPFHWIHGGQSADLVPRLPFTTSEARRCTRPKRNQVALCIDIGDVQMPCRIKFVPGVSLQRP